MNKNSFGADNILEKNRVKANSLEARMDSISAKDNLIIEENTIYEIDEDCMNCLNKEKKNGFSRL